MRFCMRYVIREKFFRLGEDSTINDEFGRPVIEVDGKVFSIHHTLIMRDLNGNELATIKKQLVALSPTYHVTRNGQEIAAIRKKIISPFVDRYSVDIAGSEELHVTGSIFEHDYTITRGIRWWPPSPRRGSRSPRRMAWTLLQVRTICLSWRPSLRWI